MINDNHFTKEAYENNGRFQIHPLSPEGLEAYLSKDSVVHHYLKSKYDPILMKQIQQEVNEEKEKNQMLNQNNIINEQDKNEMEQQNQEITEKNLEKNKGNIKNKKIQNQTKKGNNLKGYKQIKQEKDSIKNSNSNVKPNTVSQKINSLGKSVTPVISNVKNDRGKLDEFQQPYHA